MSDYGWVPESIKIGGHDYRLIVPYDFRERCDLSGQCDSARCELRIATADGGGERSESKVLVTLIHELIHACDNVSGLNALTGGSDEKEQIVEMIANGLFQVFKDNPQLRKIFE